ncbi:MAG: Type 4 prepilin-like protein leader peptide-processing enzyme [Candidatus Moranbacteria bacterium GW2011_GWE1_49_15]|nr:MAG: Type 4 prepilin-like protein leader peptide-processing enzyme [Candidatus Moranbacteria bacterium GW2011_GWE2_47_10]KKW06853.1 MAG: Type 4 prepilin-like protein leader peptide-processing enzyme [Candidatus Moranbacteria bacterium GW2011_GWE1_49_15]HBP01351.1 hypothetical protein [Candidatus Moranbacteria bacterium]
MTFIFLILGLIIGSFLNAVIYRLNAVESLWERSHCPTCKKKVRWHDNVPLLSFVLLSAKCRDCGERISWSYPAVELSTGILFALVGKYFFVLENSLTYLPTIFYLVIFSLLVIIFMYDLKFMEIPMLILWLAVGATVAFYLAMDWSAFGSATGIFSLNIFSGALAGIVAFAFFFSLAHFSKETWMGYGDAYVGLLAGLLVGWPNIFIALMLAFTSGALVGTALIFMKKKTMKSQVPFAPFLVIGVLLTLLLPKMFPQLGFFLFYF